MILYSVISTAIALGVWTAFVCALVALASIRFKAIKPWNGFIVAALGIVITGVFRFVFTAVFERQGAGHLADPIGEQGWVLWGNMSLRFLRMSIVAIYHCLVLGTGVLFIQLAHAFSSYAMLDIGAALIFFDILCWNRIPLPRMLTQLVLRWWRCRYCSLIYPVVGRFRCSCGMTSPPRHAFSRCPNDST